MTTSQKVQRRAFLQQLEASTSNILEQYLIILNEANRILLVNPTAKTMTAIESIAEEYDLDLLRQNERLLTSYQQEFQTMGNLASSHVLDFIAPKTEIDIDEIARRFEAVINNSIAEVINHIYPDGLQLSQRLWNPMDRAQIISTVVRGYQEGISPFDLAERLQDFSKTEVFNHSYRVAHTELVRMYSQSKYDSIQDWNENPEAEFEIMIRRSLSPAHKIWDICDVVAGTYKIGQKVPAVPSHPGCMCEVYEVIAVKKPTNLNKRFKKYSDRKDEWGIQKKDIQYF